MGSRFYSKRLPDRTYVRNPRKRGPSFKTEEQLKTYVAKHKITKYTIHKLKTKFRLDVE